MAQRVVIVGGGFAGVSTAQELAKRLRRRIAWPGSGGADPARAVEVLLLNRDNYFVFQPLLADILSGTIETTHVVVPLRRMLPRRRRRGRHRRGLDTAARRSTCAVA